MLRRCFWISLYTFAAIEIGLTAGLYFLAPRMALHPKHRPPTKAPLAAFENKARELGAISERVSFLGADGAKMVGTFAHSAENGRAVLLLHGFGGHRLQLDLVALPLLAGGYDVLMLDLRAHGESDGVMATFGRLETEDVARAADFLVSRGDSRLYLVGASYGGAVALSAAANDSRWRAIAVGATFAYYRSTAIGYAGTFLHLPGLVAKALLTLPAEFAVRACAREAGANLETIEPINTVQHVHAPLLVIHGENDPGIGPWQARDLLQACPASRRELWIVPGAGHTRSSLLEVSADAISDRVRRWFDAADIDVARAPSIPSVVGVPPVTAR